MQGGEGGGGAGDLIVEVFSLYDQPVDFLAALQHLKAKDVTAQYTLVCPRDFE
jgi:hypothetical protein